MRAPWESVAPVPGMQGYTAMPADQNRREGFNPP